MKNYIVNGRVARAEIASDLCDGILTREDVACLVKDPRIREAFIGTSFTKKLPKDQWNNEYLRNLPNATVSEAFNEDYLYYLADVVDYINEKKKTNIMKKRIGFGVFAVLLICTVVFLLIKYHH